MSSLPQPEVPALAGADYDRAIAVTPSDGGWTVDLDGSWSIGGAMNGGYLLAVMVNAATTATARPDSLAVTATFLSPRPVDGLR